MSGTPHHANMQLTRAGSVCFVGGGGGSFGCSRFRRREGACVPFGTPEGAAALSGCHIAPEVVGPSGG
jgi:hypothetical protein